MFYRRNTAAVAAVLAVLLSAVLLVCAPRPYSGHVWLELVMVVVCGVALGRAGVGLQSKPDASLPVSLAMVGATFRYCLFVAAMALPPILSLGMQFKYYALVHGIGLGVWTMHMLVLSMGVHSADEQDRDMAKMLEMRRTCRLRLSDIIGRMEKSRLPDDILLCGLKRLNERFRLGFGKGGQGAMEADSRIIRLLDELEEAVAQGDEAKMRSTADALELEFDGRERAARM